jgi:hypothetical protein
MLDVCLTYLLEKTPELYDEIKNMEMYYDLDITIEQ